MVATIGKILGAFVCAVLLLAIGLIAWPRSTAPLPDPRRAYLIEGVRVIDVVAGTAGAPTSVVIRDGVIEAIGASLPMAGLARVDGRGGYLAPGFWDMHIHTFRHSPLIDFPLYVANGVTNARDMMDCPGVEDSLIACVADKRRWSAQANAGRLASPRFVEVASYYFEGPALTPAEVSARASAYRARGLEALKVYNRLRRPAYLRAADEARSGGMRLVGHLPKAVSLEEAIAAGQASFEHGHVLARHCFGRAAAWRADQLDHLDPITLAEAIIAEHDPARCKDAYSRMAAGGTWYVPTHVTREEDARANEDAFIDDPRLGYLDPLTRWAYRDDLSGTRARYPGQRGTRALRAYFEHGLRLTREARRAGVRVLVGTDTAIGGFRYHDELAHLVRAGLSPAEVLRAATIEAAHYAGLEATSGSVAVGKRADLVLLDGDPLERIHNTRRIRAVFLNGRLYDRKRRKELLAFARGQAAAPHNWAKLFWNFVRSSVAADL